MFHATIYILYGTSAGTAPHKAYTLQQPSPHPQNLHSANAGTAPTNLFAKQMHQISSQGHSFTTISAKTS